MIGSQKSEIRSRELQNRTAAVLSLEDNSPAFAS